MFKKDTQYYKFCLYGFFKNLRFFDVFLVLFFLENGLSFFEIGMLYAIREITINIFEIPTGIISDSFGRRRILISAFAFYIVSFIVFYVSLEYWTLIIAMLFYALGDALRSGNHKAMIIDYLEVKGWKDAKVHYYGHTRSWSQMGSAISSLIGGAIVFYTGSFRFIFIFSVIPYIIDLLLVSTYPKFLDGDLMKYEPAKARKEIKEVFEQYVVSVKKAKLIRALFNVSLYSGYYKAIKDYLQPMIKTFALSLPVLIWMNDEQRTAIIVGVVFFIIYFLNSAASRYSGKFSESFRNIYLPLNITLIAGLIIGTLSGFLFDSELYLLATILFVFVYMTENLRKPIGVSYISETTEKKVLASALSTNSLLNSLVAAVIAPIIGILADSFGIGMAVIIISGFLLVLSPIVFARKK